MMAAGMQEIFEIMQDRLDGGEDLALAVILEAEGSTPRGKGAAMLSNAAGLLAGSVGGGALEGAVLKSAAECLKEKKSVRLDFRLDSGRVSLEGDSSGIGMICGGKVCVWVQILDAASEFCRSLAKDALSAMKDGGAFVRFDLSAQTASVVLEAPAYPEEQVCYVPFRPSERAILFGGGHVAAALAPILKSIGFRVIVMDDRPEFADPARFPDASQVVCGDFRRLSDFLTFREDDYAVVVTSGHVHDFEVEEQILRQEFAYIGVMGSRRKTALINAKLREAGITEEQFAKVHTPIGLNIGAVTPEEIAVSIAAEMIQVRAERRK